MKRIAAVLLILIMIAALSACGHQHVWRQANATEPKTCTICGKTEGEPLGYNWGEVSYEWAEDCSSITATRISGTDPSIIETETVDSTAEIVKDPTCEEPGETTYTASFENPDFESQTRTEADIPAIGHDWSEPEYTWDGTDSVTASHVCGNDASHVETETVNTTAEVTKEPTFEERGETTYTAVFENPAFETQSLTLADIEPRSYEWGEPSFTWNDDGTVTAARISGADPSIVETETAVTTAEVTKQPTCEEPGETTYTVSFLNAAFVPQTRTEADIPPLGHDWGEPEYSWDGTASVTATRVCGNDPAHVETETVSTTAEVAKEALCEAMGDTTYTAVFQNPAFETQSHTETDIPELGHAWGEPEYTWDGTASVTATRVCANDPAHVETETVSTTAEVAKEALCEAMGDTTYTAVFTNPAFETQSRTETDIPELGHAWGEPEYTWDGTASVTATRVCANDPAHVETETVSTTAEVAKEALCEAMGDTTYTAVFTNTAFETQSHTETDIPALGHAWGEPEYTWDGTASVTATRVCANDPAHVETETVSTTAEVAKEALCEAMGDTTYTAVFTNTAFETQSRTETDIPELGHDWIPATHLQPKTCARCGKTEGKPLTINYLPMRFSSFRHDFNRDYAGFLNIDTVRGDGFVLKVQGATLPMNGMEGTIFVYHGDEFHPHDEASRKALKHFNLLRIRYSDESEDFNTSISARVAELGYYTAKILDPELDRDLFFKEGLDLFSAKDREQSFVHNGFVYTLSCQPDDGGYVYSFSITMEDNVE